MWHARLGFSFEATGKFLPDWLPDFEMDHLAYFSGAGSGDGPVDYPDESFSSEPGPISAIVFEISHPNETE
jgi:hypothetical protein